MEKKSTLGLCHVNIASLSKDFDELQDTLSSIKKDFEVIGITEHKIRKDINPITNLTLEGYRPFLYDSSETTQSASDHGSGRSCANEARLGR